MDSIAIMAESKKGHNFDILDPTEKKMSSLIFCTDATHKISSTLLKRFSRYSKYLVFTKREITLAIFDARLLKFNQHIFIW